MLFLRDKSVDQRVVPNGTLAEREHVRVFRRQDPLDAGLV